jgi:hypothetical protein
MRPRSIPFAVLAVSVALAVVSTSTRAATADAAQAQVAAVSAPKAKLAKKQRPPATAGSAGMPDHPPINPTPGGQRTAPKKPTRVITPGLAASAAVGTAK